MKKKQTKKSLEISPEYLETIQKVAKKISRNYTFGHYDSEDIEQECILIGISGLAKYDGIRPLENFLSIHIKNRIRNFLRDNYYRPGCKCGICKSCSKKASKKNLLEPISIDCIDQNINKLLFNQEEAYDIEEIKNLIDEELPSEYREDYLKMLSGLTIPTSRKRKIIELVEEIIHD